MRLFLFYFFVFFLSVIQAQQPASIQLTEKDGLPDIEFYNIIEDSKQFIWLAADNGLYRYDGQNYTYYSHPKQRGNAVFGTIEDDKGQIWCNNISGQFFYTNNKSLKLFVDLGEIINGELSSFKVTQTHLLVFTAKNIYKIKLEDNKITKVFDKEYSYLGIPIKSKDHFYFTQKNQIFKTNYRFEKLDSLYINVFDNYANDSGISKSVNLATNGTLFLCYFLRFNTNTFYQFNIDNKRFNHIQIPKKLSGRSINHIFFEDNNIWIATDLGIQVYKLKGNTLEFQQELFRKINVTKIIIDQNKNYWITTKGDGIFVISNINIFKHQLPKDFINISEITKIDRNRILFGTNNGKIAIINTNNNQLKVLDSSSAFRVTEILADPYKDKAIITKEDKAFQYQFKSNNLSSLYNSNLFGSKSLSQIDTTGYVISSYKNAFLLDEKFVEQHQLLNKRSYTNYYSEVSKNIYVGSVEGFFVFDNQLNKSQICYKNQSILAVSISETKDQTIWVSTFNNGLFGIKGKHVIAHYNLSNGLLSNKIGHIESDKNNLWISSEKGVQLLDTGHKTFKNLTKQNGIPTYRVSDIEIIDDQIFFASNIGLFGLDKNKAFKTPNKKVLYFTGIKVNDSIKPIKNSYKFDYDKNKIEFSFNINGFQSKLNTQYQYRLLGADTTWKTTSELVNSVSYNSLPSGNYTFQVMAFPESEEIKSIQFSILKPFWKSWWFYVLITIFACLGVYIPFLSKIKRLKRKQYEILQKELLNKQLVFSQLENLRSQMNPHFIFNALNSIQEYIVMNEKDLASSYLIKFSRLIRIYLDHSREDEVLLSEEIKALDIYLELEKNRFEDLLDYSVTVAKDLKTNNLKVPSLFIQPYVENALKHGLLHKKEDRRLNIFFHIKDTKNLLFCEITDNGIGVEASKELNKNRQPMHRSFARSANEKRVALLNTNRDLKITVSTTPLHPETKTGTKVVITLPI